MTNKSILGGIAAALLLVLIIGAVAWQRRLEAGLPPRVECATAAEAAAQAHAFAQASGGRISPVLGTGSMAPYIPPAPFGTDPLQTVVAYVVSDPRGTFADIRPGSLVMYRAEWSPQHAVLHCAAQQDRDGWIMTGLHNDSYENRWRVTPANFLGLTARVFVWPQ